MNYYYYVLTGEVVSYLTLTDSYRCVEDGPSDYLLASWCRLEINCLV